MIDPTTLRPNDTLRHLGHDDVVILAERKATDDGWWIVGGGGLADLVIHREWMPAPTPTTDEVAAWHEDRWGGKADTTVALKLNEEAGEVGGAFIKRDEGRASTDHVLDELGDVAVVLNVLCARVGTTPDAVLARRFPQVQAR